MRGHPRHILVFEPDPRGHAEEWLLHIANFVRDRQPPVRVTLAAPAALAGPLGEVAARAAPATLGILPVDESTSAACMGRPLMRAAFARWRAMMRCLDATGAGEGVFLCLDALSLPLALGRRAGGRTLSGILFRPSVHYAEFEDGRPRAKEIIRDLRKRILYPRMLANPALTSVHSLDPYFPDYARQHFRQGAKVMALDDPTAIPTAIPRPGDACALRFPGGRTAFFHFGEITARKGVVQLLDACRRLPVEIASHAAFIVAGRIDPSLRAEIGGRLHALRRERPELWIELADRRLEEREIVDTMRACDVLVMPYQRFVGSSGLLVWAALCERPVITQRYGMVGRAVREHRLGLAVDTCDPAAIATAIGVAVAGEIGDNFDRRGARRFAEHRDSDSFARRVLMLSDAEAGTRPDESTRWGLPGITA
jgi:hypothetical protein